MEPQNHLEYIGFVVEMGIAGYVFNRIINGIGRGTGSNRLERLANEPVRAAIMASITAYPLATLFEYVIR